MRYLGSPFCEVCRHKISLDIMAIANDNTAGLPVAYFAANSLSVTSGATVAFYDMSSFSPTSWEWTFEGGSPATSTDKNPVVNYPNRRIRGIVKGIQQRGYKHLHPQQVHTG
jgi:hypothetical protein